MTGGGETRPKGEGRSVAPPRKAPITSGNGRPAQCTGLVGGVQGLVAVPAAAYAAAISRRFWEAS